MVDRLIAALAVVVLLLVYLKYDREKGKVSKVAAVAPPLPLADTASDLIPYCYRPYDGIVRKAPCETSAPRTRMTSGPALTQHGPLHSDLVQAVPWQEIQHGGSVELETPQYAFPNTMVWN